MRSELRKSSDTGIAERAVKMVVYSFYIFDRHGECVAALDDMDTDGLQRTVSTSEGGSLQLQIQATRLALFQRRQ